MPAINVIATAVQSSGVENAFVAGETSRAAEARDAFRRSGVKIAGWTKRYCRDSGKWNQITGVADVTTIRGKLMRVSPKRVLRESTSATGIDSSERETTCCVSDALVD